MRTSDLVSQAANPLGKLLGFADFNHPIVVRKTPFGKRARFTETTSC